MSAGSFFDFQERMASASRRNKEPQAYPAAAGQTALTVTQLTTKIDRVIKTGFPERVLVRGEVSNYRPNASSGHTYFTLKDENNCIDCVIWRSDSARLRFQPKDGIELIAQGTVGVYGPRGRYQLYVTTLQPLGQGALELARQQLQQKLQAEGLLAAERKRPIPPYPMAVALLTGAGTAALQDMLKVLRPFRWLRLTLYPVPVQGDGSAEKIAAAIQHLSQHHDSIGGIDVILLARGGGSLEDLWEFNEECLARAIAASAIPIVTGIGHEIDVSIADLVADRHAHTPTEAAQTIVQHWKTARDALHKDGMRLRRALLAILSDGRQRLAGIQRHEMFRRPLDRVNDLRQRLDDRQRGMTLALEQRLRAQHARLAQLSERLQEHRPTTLLARFRQRLGDLERRLAESARARIRRLHERLQRAVLSLGECHPRHQVRLEGQRLATMHAALRRAAASGLKRRRLLLQGLDAHLHALAPQNVLQRGYSITTIKKSGAVVRDAKQLKAGDRILTRLADGTAESVVEDSRQLPLFE
jgi:exodeoxyribonuclease VII large subunit